MAKSKNKRKSGKRAGVRKQNAGILRAQRFFGRTRIHTWESSWGSDGSRTAFAQTRTIRGWEDLEQDIAEGVIRYPNNWMICCRALCRTPSGSEWVEHDIRSVRSVSLECFKGLYKELRESVLAEVRTDHVVDMGWICQTWLEDRLDTDHEWYLHDIGTYSADRQQAWRDGHDDVTSELFEIAKEQAA